MECDRIKSVFLDHDEVVASKHEFLLEVFSGFLYPNEISLVVANLATESWYGLPFGVGVSRRDPLDSLVGDVSADVLVGLFGSGFAVGTEDKLTIASVFAVEFENGVAGGAGAGEEVENEGGFI